MKRLSPSAALVLAAVTAAVLAGPARAQQAIKIAVVNSSQAFQDCAEGKKAIAQFDERDKKIRAEIKKMDDAILALQSRLNTGQLTMAQDALMGIQNDIARKQTERKRFEEDQTREFTQFRNGIVQRIQTEMIEIIKALRKEKGLDLVVDFATSGIIDFEPALDITAEVVSRYDASRAAAPPVKK